MFWTKKKQNALIEEVTHRMNEAQFGRLEVVFSKFLTLGESRGDESLDRVVEKLRGFTDEVIEKVSDNNKKLHEVESKANEALDSISDLEIKIENEIESLGKEVSEGETNVLGRIGGNEIRLENIEKALLKGISDANFDIVSEIGKVKKLVEADSGPNGVDTQIEDKIQALKEEMMGLDQKLESIMVQIKDLIKEINTNKKDEKPKKKTAKSKGGSKK